MGRALDLFSGTGSVTRVLRERSWDVTSVDFRKCRKADICVDVMDWDFRAVFRPGDFDFVHSSPPCTEFTYALQCRPRCLKDGDCLVEKVLEILEYLRPRYWTIENPEGLLKTRPYMEPLATNMRRVCYCKYAEGDPHFSYRKRTCIWTNIPWTPRSMCSKTEPCEWLCDNHHPQACQGRSKYTLYAMPPALIHEWVDNLGGTNLARVKAGSRQGQGRVKAEA